MKLNRFWRETKSNKKKRNDIVKTFERYIYDDVSERKRPVSCYWEKFFFDFTFSRQLKFLCYFPLRLLFWLFLDRNQRIFAFFLDNESKCTPIGAHLRLKSVRNAKTVHCIFGIWLRNCLLWSNLNRMLIAVETLTTLKLHFLNELPHFFLFRVVASTKKTRVLWALMKTNNYNSYDAKKCTFFYSFGNLVNKWRINESTRS